MSRACHKNSCRRIPVVLSCPEMHVCGKFFYSRRPLRGLAGKARRRGQMEQVAAGRLLLDEGDTRRQMVDDLLRLKVPQSSRFHHSKLDSRPRWNSATLHANGSTNCGNYSAVGLPRPFGHGDSWAAGRPITMARGPGAAGRHAAWARTPTAERISYPQRPVLCFRCSSRLRSLRCWFRPI